MELVMSEELTPCPWCWKSDLLTVDDGRTDCFYVWCKRCGCEGPPRDTAETAMDAWNTRPAPASAPEPASGGEVDRYREGVVDAMRAVNDYLSGIEDISPKEAGPGHVMAAIGEELLVSPAPEPASGVEVEEQDGCPKCFMGVPHAEHVTSMTFIEAHPAPVAEALPGFDLERFERIEALTAEGWCLCRSADGHQAWLVAEMRRFLDRAGKVGR